MPRTPLALGLALLLFASLLVTAPARLLSALLSTDGVHMQGFTGTLWRGRASRVLVRAGSGYLHLGHVDWFLQPLSLLTLSPRLRLESRWGSQMLATNLVVHGEQDIELRNFDASVAADLVRQYAPVGLEGTLSAQFAVLRLRDGLPYRANGRLVWQHGGWLSPAGPRPLGSYAVDLQQPPGGALIGQVQTLSGPVEANGSIELTGRHYRVDILVGTDGPFETQLQRALSLLASPQGDVFQLALNGELY